MIKFAIFGYPQNKSIKKEIKITLNHKNEKNGILVQFRIQRGTVFKVPHFHSFFDKAKPCKINHCAPHLI